MSLFQEEASYQPLASRMRPSCLEQFIGQEHLLSQGKPLREAIDSSQLHSMILWGPPGVGKTTLASLIAQVCEVEFQSLSAVLAGIKEIREAIARGREFRQNANRKTLLLSLIHI